MSLTRLAPDQPSDHPGQAAPNQEPYQLAGHLTQEGDVWAVRGLTGTLGTSDLRSDIFLEMQEKRPLVRAELFSRHWRCVTYRPSVAPPAPDPSDGCNNIGEDVPSATLMDLELTRVVNVQMHFEGQTVMLANQTLQQCVYGPDAA